MLVQVSITMTTAKDPLKGKRRRKRARTRGKTATEMIWIIMMEVSGHEISANVTEAVIGVVTGVVIGAATGVEIEVDTEVEIGAETEAGIEARTEVVIGAETGVETRSVIGMMTVLLDTHLDVQDPDLDLLACDQNPDQGLDQDRDRRLHAHDADPDPKPRHEHDPHSGHHLDMITITGSVPAPVLALALERHQDACLVEARSIDLITECGKAKRLRISRMEGVLRMSRIVRITKTVKMLQISRTISTTAASRNSNVHDQGLSRGIDLDSNLAHPSTAIRIVSVPPVNRNTATFKPRI